ncbi:MAG: nuclear transport factor 2 family protein [Pseudomonadota bacterium]
MDHDEQELTAAKKAVLSHQRHIDTAPNLALADALSVDTSVNCKFQFTAPFRECIGAKDADKNFWSHLRSSFSPLQRRPDIFFAGYNHLSDEPGVWVASMGHLLGLFDQPFLGMRPTRQSTMLRYAEFNLVVDGKITESTMFLDVLNLMAQVRAEALPPSTAATMVTPGPRTHDGLLFGNQPVHEGEKTLKLFLRMIDRLLAEDVHTTNTDLSLDWTDDMIWWGPGGIGAPYTQGRYLEQHCVPFEEGLKWGDFFGHRTEFAEGHYGGFFGWPTFDVTSLGGYIGLAPKSEMKASMRVVDLYRREGEKLAENWNFIDHLHFLEQLGVDLIARQRVLTGLN